jgi:hypothetical protein
MGDPPRAHRRLVPRVTKKTNPPPIEDQDLDVTAERVILVDDSQPAMDKVARGSTDLEPDESLEMTRVRADLPLPPRGDDDFDEMTSERHAAPPGDNFDDLDAGETSLRPGLAHMLAERAVPRFDESAGPLADAPPGVLPDQIDANAFADSEPTALKAPTSLGAEDRAMTHVSPAERGLLAAMSEGHEASRMVYVNWLERRGEVVRAEFLRLDCVLAQMSPEDPRYLSTRRRLLEIAPRISLDFRSKVARSLIEGCSTTTGRCPAYWRALPSDTDDVRHCGVCRQHVYYCVSIDLARSRIAEGQRVAVDVTVDRYHGDLDSGLCNGCHQQIPSRTRFCPHCGRMQQ